MKVIRALGRGEEADLGGTVIRFPWIKPGAELPVWMAAYGPKALKMAGEEADGFILQLADLYLTEYMVKTVKDAASAAGRDPSEVKICVAAPAYVTEDDSPKALAHAREQCRWFGGMVGNHVADLVAKYGEHSGAVPDELTAYIKAREGYDYAHHGRSGNPDTQFVPDEIVDRFCVIGPAERHVEKLTALRELGVDQFALYDMHDAQEAVIDAYGSRVIPAVNA
jgi:probable F420-dependent oxidoreductase